MVHNCMTSFLWVLVAEFAATLSSVQLNNGLTPLPPMGFANWNGFACNYTDATFRTQANALVQTGLKDKGYKILIIQECITPAGHRDVNGVPQPTPERFPYGIKNLVDYFHSLGLKGGIYTDVGPQTCAGYEGSFNHEIIDAKTYASWGIDFVEEDACHKASNFTYRELYTRMRNALNATGRPIIFYMCVWGQEHVYEWGPSVGNLWRSTGDICTPGHANWNRMVNNFRGNARFPNATGPEHWQDPDMLVVGLPGMTPMEWQTHFNLWCISAAPLWIGIDISKASSVVLNILGNDDAIAVDQDPLGKMGTQRPTSTSANGGEVWVKKLTPMKGEQVAFAVLFVNFGNASINSLGIDVSQIGLTEGKAYKVRDLWSKKSQSSSQKVLVVKGVGSHGSVLYRVSQ